MPFLSLNLGMMLEDVVDMVIDPEVTKPITCHQTQPLHDEHMVEQNNNSPPNLIPQRQTHTIELSNAPNRVDGSLSRGRAVLVNYMLSVYRLDIPRFGVIWFHFSQML